MEEGDLLGMGGGETDPAKGAASGSRHLSGLVEVLEASTSQPRRSSYHSDDANAESSRRASADEGSRHAAGSVESDSGTRHRQRGATIDTPISRHSMDRNERPHSNSVTGRLGESSRARGVSSASRGHVDEILPSPGQMHNVPFHKVKEHLQLAGREIRRSTIDDDDNQPRGILKRGSAASMTSTFSQSKVAMSNELEQLRRENQILRSRLSFGAKKSTKSEAEMNASLNAEISGAVATLIDDFDVDIENKTAKRVSLQLDRKPRTSGSILDGISVVNVDDDYEDDDSLADGYEAVGLQEGAPPVNRMKRSSGSLPQAGKDGIALALRALRKTSFDNRRNSFGENVRRRRKSSVDGGHEATHEFTQVAQLESFDYEPINNRLEHQAGLDRPRWEAAFERMWRWMVALILGISIGTVAYLMTIAVSIIVKYKFEWTNNLLHRGRVFEAYLLYLFICCLLIFIAALLVYWAPESAGSGIPQVKAYLNGNRMRGILRMRTLIAKVVGITCCVAIGTPSGREGPMVHAGSIIAAGLARGGSKALRMRCSMLRWFNTDRARRDFISMGSAAGVAAAFNAPIGGILFALEEVSSFWSAELTWQSFFCAIVSAFTISFLLSGGLLGKTVHDEGLVLFGSDEHTTYHAWEIVFFLILGCVGGALGSLYVWINLQISRLRKRLFAGRKGMRILEALIWMCIAITIIFFLPFAFSCQPIPDFENKNSHITFTQHTCDDGEYNDMATLILGPQEGVLVNLYARQTQGHFREYTLLVFFVVYALLAVTKYGIAVPAGLFIPTMLIGASLGRIFGEVLALILNVDPGMYALIGAASMLGGVTRMTISLTIILVEITNDINNVLPVMLALWSSKLVGDRLIKSIYEVHMDLAGVPYLESDPPPSFDFLTARDAMNDNIVTVDEVETVGDMFEKLKHTQHNAFPVIDRGRSMMNRFFMGVITREQLLILLKKKAWALGQSMIPLKEFNRQLGKATDMTKVTISEYDRNMRVSLRPYMDPSPFVVQETLGMRRVYRLFRAMGLRHLFVTDSRERVVGVITRKDLLRLEHEGRSEKVIERTKSRLSVVEMARASSVHKGNILEPPRLRRANSF